MRITSVRDLKSSTRLTEPVYDCTGAILMNQGERLGRERVRLLEQHGISVVYQPEPGEDVSAFFGDSSNIPIEVERLEVGSHTTQPLYDAKGVLLLKAEMEITHEFIQSFLRRGIRVLYAEQSAEERKASARQVAAFRSQVEAELREKMSAEMGRLSATPVEVAPEDRVSRPEEVTSQAVAARVEAELGRERKRAERAEAEAEPEEPSFAEEIELPPPEEARSEEVKTLFVEGYAGLAAELANIFRALRKKQTVPADRMGKIVGEAMSTLRDVDIFLSLAAHPPTDDPLVVHSIRVGFFSIAAATALKYGRQRIYQLAHGAFLLDIGLLRVDRQILRKVVKLTTGERREINRHVEYGVEMTRQMPGLPWLASCILQQSHERCDGSGYPEGRGEEGILEYARIVGACDVYAALSEGRPHRKAMLPYRAMEGAVRLAGRRWIDPRVVRGLMRYTSLFPVGSWVELASGARARVVSANPEDVSRPVISICLNQDGDRIDPVRVNLLGHPEVKIRRPIDGSGLVDPSDPLVGF